MGERDRQLFRNQKEILVEYVRVSPLCVRICSLRVHDWWKHFSQYGHWCGLMPLCRFMWSISVPLCENRFEQMLHWCTFISSWPRMCFRNCSPLPNICLHNSHENLSLAPSGSASFLWIFMCEASDSLFSNARAHRRQGNDVGCCNRVDDSARAMVCLMACRFKLLADENRHRHSVHSNGLPVSSWMRMWRRRLYIFGNNLRQCKHSNVFFRQFLPTHSTRRTLGTSIASMPVPSVQPISTLMSSPAFAHSTVVATEMGSASLWTGIFWVFAMRNCRTFASLDALNVWNSNATMSLPMQSMQINGDRPSSIEIVFCVHWASISANEMLSMKVVNKSFSSRFGSAHTRHQFRKGFTTAFTSFMVAPPFANPNIQKSKSKSFAARNSGTNSFCLLFAGYSTTAVNNYQRTMRRSGATSCCRFVVFVEIRLRMRCTMCLCEPPLNGVCVSMWMETLVDDILSFILYFLFAS